jgi:hypothetical protein
MEKLPFYVGAVSRLEWFTEGFCVRDGEYQDDSHGRIEFLGFMLSVP